MGQRRESMFKIARLDLEKMCKNLIERIRTSVGLLIVLVMLIILSGCTGVIWFDDWSGNRSCKAYCRTFAEDGESCVEWSETASDACVGKYTPVAYCCVGWGNRCPLATPGAKGFACTCPVSTPYGLTYVQGKACT